MQRVDSSSIWVAALGAGATGAAAARIRRTAAATQPRWPAPLRWPRLLCWEQGREVIACSICMRKTNTESTYFMQLISIKTFVPMLFSYTPLPTPAAVYNNKAETCTKKAKNWSRKDRIYCMPTKAADIKWSQLVTAHTQPYSSVISFSSRFNHVLLFVQTRAQQQGFFCQ